MSCGGGDNIDVLIGPTEQKKPAPSKKKARTKNMSKKASKKA
jgi:hypothetical protein